MKYFKICLEDNIRSHFFKILDFRPTLTEIGAETVNLY